MTVLQAALKRMDDRTGALGAADGSTVQVSTTDGLALLLSGLPTTAEEFLPPLQDRTVNALRQMAAGEDPMAVISGALAEAVLVGFYMGQEESG
jgi:hypothetical protein